MKNYVVTISFLTALVATSLNARGWVCANTSFPPSGSNGRYEVMVEICKQSCDEKYVHAFTTYENEIDNCQTQYPKNTTGSQCYCWPEKSKQGASTRTYYNAR